jgi:hypothetical protein
VPFPWTRINEVLQWHSHRNRDLGLVWLRKIFVRATQEMLASETH